MVVVVGGGEDKLLEGMRHIYCISISSTLIAITPKFRFHDGYEHVDIIYINYAIYRLTCFQLFTHRD